MSIHTSPNERNPPKDLLILGRGKKRKESREKLLKEQSKRHKQQRQQRIKEQLEYEQQRQQRIKEQRQQRIKEQQQQRIKEQQQQLKYEQQQQLYKPHTSSHGVCVTNTLSSNYMKDYRIGDHINNEDLMGGLGILAMLLEQADQQTTAAEAAAQGVAAAQ